MIGKSGPVCQSHQTETPWVGKPDKRAISDMKNNMFVRMVTARIVRKTPGGRRPLIGRFDNHPPRHPEMGEKYGTVVEFSDQIFCAASQLFQCTAQQAIREIVRYRNAQVVAPDLDPLNPATFHRLGKTAADCFDFR